MVTFSPVQSKWIEIAEEFDQKSKGRSDVDLLQQMLEENTDDFIKLIMDSQREKINQYQFKSGNLGDPDKTLHDKLFKLAEAFEHVKPSKKVTNVLLKHLLGDSLLKCFPL